MKKSIRILAIAMVAIMLCLTLASCGKRLSGKYEMVVVKEGGFLDSLVGAIGEATNSSVYYIFKGNKLTVEATVGGQVETTEYEYEIKDDKMTLTYVGEGAEELEEDELSNTVTFEELENGNLKIGGVEFKPVEE
jgi:protein involved in sex pheromone biosynthesis